MDKQKLQAWVVEKALPLWSEIGVDRRFGGFHEQLDADLRPIEQPRRVRLAARQIFCFALGPELGWAGPAGELVENGRAFLGKLVDGDGRVAMAMSLSDGVRDMGYDPYDYAFVLLALATTARQDGALRSTLLEQARSVRDYLVAGWAHPMGGFRQGLSSDLPLLGDPQMHLLEAFLACAAIDEKGWRSDVNGMANLALDRLIMPNGALPEHFDGDWRPVGDELLVSPGHQFEWAWLLARVARLSGDAGTFSASFRLADLAERYGVDCDRGVAMSALDGEFRLRDASAKLWMQAERCRAWHEIAGHPLSSATERERASAALPSAIAGLWGFLEPRGTWHEVMRPDGDFVEQPIRASSLYHIVGAVHALAN